MAFDFGNIPLKIGKGIQKIFGSANEREVAKLRELAKPVNVLEERMRGMDQAAIKSLINDLKKQVQGGKTTLDEVLNDVFAVVRVAAERTVEMRHFDVQILGGLVLHQGKIAEMVTGEGKTLVATLAASLNALTGKGVYIVTVNDYLAQRDRDWMAPIFEYLGLSVGAIQSDMGSQARLPQYACDITYGTNNEFGFDYLRDNMKFDLQDQVQKNLNYAIIDEVDSILVDEARTPLIISGDPDDDSDKYRMADRIARQLVEGEDFEVKLKDRQALLLEAGSEKAEKLAGVDSFYTDPKHMDWPHHIENALRAHFVYNKDEHYIVEQDEIIIVDEFTGRKMSGRRWSDGLHQAVEAKEGIKPRQELQTMATITFQNYFRLFDKIAGMTGTAMTEASEFQKIYKLSVVQIPTNMPLIREDMDDQIYLGEEDKYNAVVDDVNEKIAANRPVLIGTTSIEKSERLSRRLKKEGIEHKVLNAKYHMQEAKIIEGAGQPGSVVVATNMAGRGTDIKLGEGVAKAGGLHIIGTERHEARRIDNQLRGRCGRQGDPGSTRFYLSFDDDLMRIFAREWVKSVMEKLGFKAGEVIESPMVSRGLRKAQKKVEMRNFEIRKNLLEYDEVMDKQRKFIYGQRQEVLESFGLEEKILGMFEEVVEEEIEVRAGDDDKPIDTKGLKEWYSRKLGPDRDFPRLEDVKRDELFEALFAKIKEHFEGRREELGTKEQFSELCRFLLLQVIDSKWKDHLKAMDDLKTGIALRGYAQVNPKNEYKKEGYIKFEELKKAIAREVSDLFFRVEIRNEDMMRDDPFASGMDGPQGLPSLPSDPDEARAMIQAMAAAGQLPPDIIQALQDGAEIDLTPGKAPPPAKREAPKEEAAGQPASVPKIGRNEPCPCGSGKKYKKCHMLV